MKPDVQFINAVGIGTSQVFKGVMKTRDALGVTVAIEGDDRQFFVPWSNVACLEIREQPKKK